VRGRTGHSEGKPKRSQQSAPPLQNSPSIAITGLHQEIHSRNSGLLPKQYPEPPPPPHQRCPPMSPSQATPQTLKSQVLRPRPHQSQISNFPPPSPNSPSCPPQSQISDLRSQIPRPRLPQSQISNLKFQISPAPPSPISNLKSQISNLRRPAFPYLKSQISDLRSQIPRPCLPQSQISNLKSQISNFSPPPPHPSAVHNEHASDR
jgi:hypothetical protein